MIKTRFIDGKIEEKVYAYRHPRDPDKFGVLHAVSYDDARKALGRQVNIRAVWVHAIELLDASFDRDRKLAIVNVAFADEAPPQKLACHSCGVEFVGSKIQCQSARGGGRVYCSRKCQVKVAAKWSIRPARRTNGDIRRMD